MKIFIGAVAMIVGAWIVLGGVLYGLWQIFLG